MTQLNQSDVFPFQLSDITGWIVKMKNGTFIKTTIVNADQVAKVGTALVKAGGYNYGPSWGKSSGYSAWCNHEPKPDAGDSPIFQSEGIGLWIGDCIGARKVQKQFDFCIDGGNVLDVPGEHDLPTLYGDPKLRQRLGGYLTNPPSKAKLDPGATRILKIRWADRAKPPVLPEFWTVLLDELRAARDKGKFGDSNPLRVMTICMGGHGRSGSAAAALIMAMSDYTPLDALTHIRAMHCARAIESKEQHEYLNLVAAHLGREQNAMEAEGVPSFKDRLLKMTSPYTKTAIARLTVSRAAGAIREEREGAFL